MAKEKLVTATEGARLCRVTIAMFARYELECVEKRGRYKMYRLDDVLDCITERARKKGYQQGLAEGKSAIPDDAAELLIEKERAELLLKREQGETQRLRNEETRRQLARVDLLTYALGKVCGQLVAILDALPGALKRSLPSLTASEIEIARREVAKCLNAVAEAEIDLDDYPGDAADG